VRQESRRTLSWVGEETDHQESWGRRGTTRGITKREQVSVAEMSGGGCGGRRGEKEQGPGGSKRNNSKRKRWLFEKIQKKVLSN